MDPLSFEEIEPFIKIGLSKKNQSIHARLEELAEKWVERLEFFSIFNQSLSKEGIEDLFTRYDLAFGSDEEQNHWIFTCLGHSLIQVEQDGERTFFCPDKDTKTFFTNELSTEIINKYHRESDRIYFEWYIELAAQLEIQLPEDEEAQRLLIIGPNGLLDSFIHLPQQRGLFSSSLQAAINWHDHLYELGHYDEASHIANMACFALAREGHRPLAEALLVRIISVTKGMSNLVSRTNLATLLREESKIDAALVIYKGIILGYIKEKGFSQLVIVFSEMGAIYRQKGRLFTAALLLECCSLLHGFLKNYKSQAIARSQLASVYRYQKLFGLALHASKLAVGHFRKSGDLLNLGRSLITRGNILFNLKSANSALSCFEEALTIGDQISDVQSVCGALSGKARVYMLTNNLQEVKPLLDQVIDIRLRNSDHSVGIEYQNLGYYYELTGNLRVALVWYQKALKLLKQYNPVEVPGLERKISNIEKRLASSRT